jgi:hypothetical protein
MMRYLGSIIGTGLLGAILTRTRRRRGSACFAIFGVLVVVSVLAAATTLFIHRFPPHEPAIETEPLPSNRRSRHRNRTPEGQPASLLRPP